MPIVGFNFTKIFVEKKEKLDPTKDQITNAVNLLDMKEENMSFSEGKGLLQMSFQFEVLYGKAEKMSLEGVLLFMDSPDKAKELLESWNVDRKLDSALSTEIFNTILFKCNIKALQLADDVGLPAHFRIPLIRPKVISEK